MCVFVLVEESPETGSRSYQVEDCTKDKAKRPEKHIP